MNSYRVRTGRGTVHSMTDGRTYTQRGELVRNDAASVVGKADCGALTSSAASHTTDEATCAKCVELAPVVESKSGPSHDPSACAVRGCMWIDAVIR